MHWEAGLSLVPILQTATSCVESSLLAEAACRHGCETKCMCYHLVSWTSRVSQALEDCAREEMEDPGFVLEVKLLLPTYQTWVMSRAAFAALLLRLALSWSGAPP